MCVDRRFAGGCICAFGLGALLTVFLPLGVMLVVEGVTAVCAGILTFRR